MRTIKDEVIFPNRLSQILKWKYPLYRIPKLTEYSQEIIDFSIESKQLPFYLKFDINNDGKDEIMLIHRSIIGGYGRLLIISENKSKFNFSQIKWNRPVNAMFFDYLIEQAPSRKYKTIKSIFRNNNDLKIPAKIDVNYPHILTKGCLNRIVYWNGEEYCQEKISSIDGETKVVMN